MRCDLRIAVVVVAGALLGPVTVALACGPWFQPSLLADRDAELDRLPDGVFMEEVRLLVPAPEPKYLLREPGVVDPDAPKRPDPYVGGSAEERALYDRGAELFHEGDYEGAHDQFRQLLALPPEQRKYRSTWAAFMLGRLSRRREMVAHYRSVRQLVADGYRDQRGLAAESLGQEARILLDNGDTVGAIQLYALQAAHGHTGGALSLLMVVRDLVEEEREAELLADPVGQRLLAVFLYTRAHELTEDQIDRVLAAFGDREAIAGTDRLAAAAYRAGQWERAGQLAERDPDSQLSLWVRAKLALRGGDDGYPDQELAAELLVESEAKIEALATACPRTATLAWDRISAERALLALRDEDRVQALQLAWQARYRYPEEVLYIAERVVTLEELERFVRYLPEQGNELEENWDWGTGNASVNSLRSLLGRRLMRVGRWEEAAQYLQPQAAEQARRYTLARRLAELSDDPLVRAEALYRASRIAREHGLEIIGTSHAPDWAMYYGEFDRGFIGEFLRGEWVSPQERRSAIAHAPDNEQRYHYRYLASELAELAADQLPHQSQAFAATLCHSARYIFYRDPDRLKQLWDRYVAEGPWVEWAGDFGHRCPEPDFAGAGKYLRSPSPRHRHWALVAAGAAMLLLLVGASGRRRTNAVT